MSNTVIIKRSAAPNAVPTTGQLTYGELAINYLDGNLFYRNSSDQIVTIASNQFVSVTGNITGGNVSAVGNVAGSYIIGNGAFLTGITSTAAFSNIAVPGQTNIVANSTGVLNITATGSTNGTTLTTDPSTGTLTISSVTGDLIFQSGYYAGLGSIQSQATALNDLGTVNGPTYDTYDLGTFFYEGAYIDNTWLYPNSITGDKLNNATSISTTGNITAGYFFGNVACASGISTTKIFNGTSEANIGTAGGNANISIGGVSNVAVFTTTGLSITGNIVPTANITYSLGTPTQRWKDLYLAGNSIYLGNIILSDVGNSFVSPNVSATGNVTAGGIISTTGNVTGGNLITAALVQGATVSASGNVIGVNILGTNITGTLTTAAQPNVTSVGTLTSLNSGTISSSGNVTGANINTAGLITATGNITGGNLTTAGQISATGNITGGNILGGANVNATTHTGATVSVTGNITGGNLVTAGSVTATGNIQTSLNTVWANTSNTAKVYQFYNSATSSIDTVFL